MTETIINYLAHIEDDADLEMTLKDFLVGSVPFEKGDKILKITVTIKKGK